MAGGPVRSKKLISFKVLVNVRVLRSTIHVIYGSTSCSTEGPRLLTCMHCSSPSSQCTPLILCACAWWHRASNLAFWMHEPSLCSCLSVSIFTSQFIHRKRRQPTILFSETEYCERRCSCRSLMRPVARPVQGTTSKVSSDL